MFIFFDKNQLCAHRPRFKFCSQSSFARDSHVTDMGKIREAESYLIFTLTSTRMLASSSLHRRCRVHFIPVFRPVPEFKDPLLRKKKPKTLVFNDWKHAFWACFRETGPINSDTGLICMLVIPEPQLSRNVCLVYFLWAFFSNRATFERRNIENKRHRKLQTCKLYSMSNFQD